MAAPPETADARLARSEARLAAHAEIARALSESTSVPSATCGVMKAIGENLGWVCAFFWCVGDAGRLHVEQRWLAEEAVTPFAEATKSTSFAPGEGLPGRVWSEGEPAWIDRLDADATFSRRAMAERCGLCTAFAFPLRVDGRLLGVIEFFRKTFEVVDASFLTLMRSVGGHLGHVIARIESQQWSAAVLEASLDAIVSIDHHGIIVEWNPAAERVFGVSRADAVGREMGTVIVPSAMRDAHRAGLARAVGGGATRILGQRVELTAIRGDGTELPVELTITRVGKDDPPKFTGFIRDITARVEHAREREELLAREKAARASAEADRAELARADRLKDEVLATASHELRTPLQAILGWATLLQTGPHDAAARKAARIIERNATAQAQLINDVLDISRIVSGSLQIARTAVDVAATIEGALDALRPTAAAKDVTLKVVYEGALGTVEGDPERLQQVLGNLLANAAKFTPSGGSVEVSARAAPAWVEIRVRDTGEGIAPGFLPHVFERFRQADGSTTRRHGGLGLGLAIVRHLVELHGGTVRAESPGLGKGATFIVALPALTRADVPAPRVATPPRTKGLLDGVRALVVDDHEDAREVLGMALTQAGATVDATPGALGALAHLERPGARYDVVVTDIGMPDIDGFGFLDRARAALGERTPPFIAISAFAGEGDARRAGDAGFALYLSKPVRTADLVTNVMTLVASSARAGTTRNE
jgi:PAS domain S-box-containing protein